MNNYAMSKRRRTAIIALCLLAGAILLWLDHSPIRDKWQRQPSDAEKYHKKTFTVVNVVDGDTIDIDVPDGKYDHTRIRLWGIDTPETKNPRVGVCYFGPEAADFTKKLALGKPATVYLDEQRTRGKYGRLLAYIQLPNGSFLNEVLLIEGFAYADLWFRHNFYHKYKQLDANARRRKKGLWEKVRPDQLPEWLQRRNQKLNLSLSEAKEMEE